MISFSSYLHSCCPPIIHGNLTCDTIFIQHNGLVKIGSVAPDTIHHHVKTCRENMKNMHFIAPEYGASVSPAIDVYSFGMCALEMAALEIQGNGDSGTLVTEDHINRTIDSLDDLLQKDFIHMCLAQDPKMRQPARELLFHPILFEVHSLKLLSTHVLVHRNTANTAESITDEVVQKLYGPEVVVAEICHPDRPGVKLHMSDVPVTEKLEKFVEDVKYGIYPLTAYRAKQPPPPRPRAISPEVAESVKSVTPEPVDVEARRVITMMCNIKPKEQNCDSMMILLRMDDKMNRQLTCQISSLDNSVTLAQELVYFGFINEADKDTIAKGIDEAFREKLLRSGADATSNQTLLLPSPAPTLHSTS
uniref:Protein kinase domain-containing protein n=1 Tax=Clastoptera arizonana TaxID=38151 RepID=A0A1B6CMT4_9HEMI